MSDRNLRILGVLFLLTACDGQQSGLDSADAGRRDAAFADAGAGIDAGAPLDAGPTPDAGQDAGPGPDAAAPHPSLSLGAHSGGSPMAAAIDGERLFVAVGPRLVALDLDGLDPAGASPPLPGIVTSLATAGARAYVTERWNLEGSLQVIDIAGGFTVTASRTYAANTAYPTDLAIDGDRLYLSDTETGLLTFDIANPDAPTLLDAYALPGAAGVQVTGGRLYYLQSGLGGSGLGAFDLEGFAHLGIFSLPGVLEAVVTPDHYAVGSGVSGIHVHAVPDLGTPRQVHEEAGVYSKVVALDDRAAYIPAEDGLHVLDLTNPEAPVISRTSTPALTSGAAAAAAGGEKLFVLSDRGFIAAYDATDPTNPTSTDRIDLPCTHCGAVRLHRGMLFVADLTSGLRVLDPDTLETIGRFELPVAAIEDVAIAGDLAFLSDWFSGLYVVDVSDPANPVQRAHLPTPGYPSAVEVAGDTVYLGEGTNGGWLRVIDVSNPDRPLQTGASTTSKARDLAVEGATVYVADEALPGHAGGLRVFDAGSGRAVKIGHYDTCDSAISVDVEGDVAALACADRSVHFVDISNPAAPTFAGRLTLDDRVPQSVTLAGSRAYVGHDRGVVVVDIRDLEFPEVVAGASAAFPVRRLEVTPDTIFGAASAAGLYRWDFLP